jgi:hypothetical protein
VQGQTIGWRVHSPIDIELSPLTQHQVAVTENPQVWFREQTALALDPPSWLSAYQFKKGENWGYVQPVVRGGGLGREFLHARVHAELVSGFPQ